MRCKYTFEVVADSRLRSPLHFTHQGLKFSFLQSNDRISAIEVEAKHVQFIKYPRVEPGKMLHLKIPFDPMLYRVQIQLRAVRGALAIWGIHDINTAEPKVEWVPETQDEQTKTDIFGHSFKTTPIGENKPLPVQEDLLVRTIIAREEFQSQRIPLEFYRRGCEDVYYSRYIEAIYDFYFTIEYMFADGNFKKSATVKAFVANPNLISAINDAQKECLVLVQGSTAETKMMLDKYSSKSVEQVLNALVDLRGQLHHQSVKNRSNWEPDLQDQFRVDALFFQCLAQSAVSKEAIDILFSEEQTKEFLSTPVYTGSGGRINWVPLDDDQIPHRKGMS